MHRLWLPIVFLCLTAVHPAWSEEGAHLACELPPDLLTPSAPLAGTADALTHHASLDILALGSGSTVGDSAGSLNPAMAMHTPDESFPYRMAEALRAIRPEVKFNLTVKGRSGMTSEEMLLILRKELSDHHYDLILWQTGTVEAVHGVRPEALHAVLQDGAEAAEQAHADLVLINPQFSRFLRANVDLAPYETVLQQMTDSPGVTVFSRLDLTQDWVNNGEIDLERVSREQRDATIALLNNCLGQALARYVLTGADTH